MDNIFKENITQIKILNCTDRYYQKIKKYLSLLEQVAKELEIKEEINIIPVDSNRMKRLSIKHKKENKNATVLTFNFDGWSEIYISVYNICTNNSVDGSEMINREIKNYLIHCLLNIKKIDESDKEKLYWTLLQKYEVI